MQYALVTIWGLNAERWARSCTEMREGEGDGTWGDISEVLVAPQFLLRAGGRWAGMCPKTS